MTSKPRPTVSVLFLSIAAALCIPAVCAGNVESAKVNCGSPQGWVFAFNKEGAKEPGVSVWRLEATSPTNATLPQFSVEFVHSADGIRHTWHAGNPFWSGYTHDWRLNPLWHGVYKTGVNCGARRRRMLATDGHFVGGC